MHTSKTTEIAIKKKFVYTVTENVFKSLPVAPPLDNNPIENNKKQINKLPSRQKHKNLVAIDRDKKELFFTVPLRFKNSLHLTYLPDPVTLFLHLSFEALKKIMRLEESLEINYKPGTVVLISETNNYHQKKIGNVISVIVFLMMAVEALANELLPDQGSISNQVMTKSEMEKRLSIEKKFNVIRNKGLDLDDAALNRIFYLKELRDNIVHFKSQPHNWKELKSFYPYDEIVNIKIKEYFDAVVEFVGGLSPGRIQHVNQ